MSSHQSSIQPSVSVFHRIIHDTRSLGVLLILCTVVSLLLTNMEATGARYVNFWETVIPGFHQLHLPHTIVHFINDALMSLFFFYVAIDIKREATSGELSSPRRMMFPAVSALFGVAVPALIFILFTVGTVGSRGWAIPSATDIAFTLGIISLLGKAVPHSMKVFLTALAIIDDLCAILIIALFYGSALHIVWLVAVALLGVVIFIVNRHLQNKMGTFLMILLGLGMWYSMYRSGIHASFAGVILAFLLPTQKLGTFERKLTFPVNFIVIPIFALANTSIVVSSAAITGLSSPLSIGIILGLFVGKPLGITIAVYLMTKFRLVRLGESVNLLQFIGVGILAGIGFTMSIFVSILAFPDDEILRDIAKLSVLIASTLAMIVGYLWLKVISKVKEKNNPDS
ncbi:MAG TPA: Na+/H+ antiporter NhaA [Porphyromonadaceae bacterium]|nr:Na+/H+ antiporter NhaA [Porphyromonadaceae bacterium]HCC18524.1 Na+/H+ antiporter NhaA [Porphyromonadaceae bacterium]